MPRVPNLFIVGAPRCASTFLYTYLAQHPEIYMSPRKEPRYFCADLDSGSEADARLFIRDPDLYFSLFDGARDEKRLGESCVFNLFSKVAAGRIHEASPDARILITLRDPADQVHSFHAKRFSNGSEDLSLEDALAAEEDRKQGRRLPRNASNIKMYAYRDVARYSGQVQRYLDTFGPDRVRIIIYEEFLPDPATSFRDTLEFLGVDPDFRGDLQVVNPNKAPRSAQLGRLLRDVSFMSRAKRRLPGALHVPAHALRKRLKAWNMRQAARSGMPPELRRRLNAEFAEEIEQVGAIVGRDLRAVWGREPEVRSS